MRITLVDRQGRVVADSARDQVGLSRMDNHLDRPEVRNAFDDALIASLKKSFAGIEKDIVLSSAINIIEIWDKQKYEHAIDEAASDFAELAEEVMGNFDDHGIS